MRREEGTGEEMLESGVRSGGVWGRKGEEMLDAALRCEISSHISVHD